MNELKKILDDTILKSLDMRPEVKWLQEKYDLFMQKNNLTSKMKTDELLYEKMYAALPERNSQMTKLRLWRTGHHIPSDRNQILMLGKALGLSGEDQQYLMQVYADRSDMIFDTASLDNAAYQERLKMMDTMIQEYLMKLHPAELIQFKIFSGDPLPSLRHIYFSHACEYTFRSNKNDIKNISRMASISYGSELLRNTKLLGDIPRKTMIRHILIMCIPFINERVINTYLSAFGYCSLDPEHTLTGGERFDAMLLQILDLYHDCCQHKSPKECIEWLQGAFRYTDQYLRAQGKNRLRPFYFKTLEKEET
ncbi:MAG: hypothetical protein SPF19_06345 [Oliverpabstia sp.]|nr:hypothetical protein [Lachnospiraceae bacterium]MDY5026129.1 hypothetical protein [Oliverpabstia sp.]